MLQLPGTGSACPEKKPGLEHFWTWAAKKWKSEGLASLLRVLTIGVYTTLYAITGKVPDILHVNCACVGRVQVSPVNNMVDDFDNCGG